MKFSLATILLAPPGGQPALPDLAERQRVFEWAASSGFTGVELSPRWLDWNAFSARELGELARQTAAVGLAISGVNVNRCIFTRTERSTEHFASVRRAIETAAILEADTVTISLSLPEQPGAKRTLLRGCDVAEYENARAAEGVAELAAHAARAGVQLSLELHDDGLLDTAELCLEMLRRVGARNVGVNPNLGNLIRSGSDADRGWEASLHWLAPHANNWHVKNYKKRQPAALWDGDIDYARAIAKMRSVGYSSWVNVESNFGDAFDSPKRSVDYLKRLLATEVTVVPEPVS